VHKPLHFKLENAKHFPWEWAQPQWAQVAQPPVEMGDTPSPHFTLFLPLDPRLLFSVKSLSVWDTRSGELCC